MNTVQISSNISHKQLELNETEHGFKNISNITKGFGMSLTSLGSYYQQFQSEMTKLLAGSCYEESGQKCSKIFLSIQETYKQINMKLDKTLVHFKKFWDLLQDSKVKLKDYEKSRQLYEHYCKKIERLRGKKNISLIKNIPETQKEIERLSRNEKKLEDSRKAFEANTKQYNSQLNQLKQFKLECIVPFLCEFINVLDEIHEIINTKYKPISEPHLLFDKAKLKSAASKSNNDKNSPSPNKSQPNNSSAKSKRRQSITISPENQSQDDSQQQNAPQISNSDITGSKQKSEVTQKSSPNPSQFSTQQVREINSSPVQKQNSFRTMQAMAESRVEPISQQVPSSRQPYQQEILQVPSTQISPETADTLAKASQEQNIFYSQRVSPPQKQVTDEYFYTQQLQNTREPSQNLQQQTNNSFFDFTDFKNWPTNSSNQPPIKLTNSEIQLQSNPPQQIKEPHQINQAQTQQTGNQISFLNLDETNQQLFSLADQNQKFGNINFQYMYNQPPVQQVSMATQAQPQQPKLKNTNPFVDDDLI